MNKIKIQNKLVGEGESCFIVAEAGVNHNGDIKEARKLIDAIVKTGADAVKFQTWKTENIILAGTDMAEYQKKNLKSKKSQFAMLKELELQYDAYFGLKKYAEKKGLILFSTMEDPESLDFLIKQLNVPVIKVGSGDLTNYILLQHTAQLKKPIILSTGMATMDEVEQAVKVVRGEGNENIILLQCTTQYPCSYDNANVNVMVAFRERFKTIVGFSDHTMGIECAIAAVALGAKVIEKHITLDKYNYGPDHKASLNPEEFKDMVTAIKNVEKALGNGAKKPSAEELKIKKFVIRKIVAAHDIAKGKTIEDKDVVFKRSNEGLEAKYYSVMVKGKVAKRDIKENTLIKSRNLQ